MFSSCGLCGGRFAFHLAFGRRTIWALGATFALTGQSFAATAESSKSDADRLIATAAQAGISGEVSKAFALLKDAIRIDPENQLARWQLGQVKVDKQWVTV